MVDIETTGLSPDVSGIMQIAAVRFSLDPQAVDHDFFNQCLEIPPTRHWDMQTLTWWNTMPDTLNDIHRRMRPAVTVMEDFYKWVGGADSGPVFWSKPLSFDYPFIQSYFKQYGNGLPMPFPYYKARDLRSFMGGLNFPYSPFDEKSVEFEGKPHDGIFDTLHQVKLLFAAINAPKEKTIDVT